jgi:hypothetical protein
MSALGQKQTSDCRPLMPQKRTFLDLFDHLVCEGDQTRGDAYAEGFGGLKIDHEFVFGRLDNR